MTIIIKNKLVQEKQDIIRKLDSCSNEERIILNSRLKDLTNLLNTIPKEEIKMETKTLKIKADVLKNFLEKTTVDGMISDCLLTFGKDGLEVGNKDMPGIIAIKGLFGKTNFTEYTECELKVKSSKNLISALSTFGTKIINIVKENNMMRLMDENGGYDFVEAEEITCKLEKLPNLEYDNHVAVDKNVVKDILAKNNIIKDERIVIATKDKQLFFRVGKEVDKAEVKTTYVDDTEKIASFNIEYFSKMANEFDGVFDMYLDSEKPVKFTEKTDKFSIEYYLCPISLVE